MKPREWWIVNKSDGQLSAHLLPSDYSGYSGAVRSIEYSAYEQAIKERDEALSNDAKCEAARVYVSGLLEEARTTIKEIEVLCHESLNDVVDERAHAQKLVEALRELSRDISTGATYCQCASESIEALIKEYESKETGE